MYNYLGVVYNVEPATSEMKALIEVDKFLCEEILIPAVSKKFTFIRFPLPLFHVFSHFSLMSLSSPQAEAAKKVNEKMIKKKKKMMMTKKDMIVIVEEDEKKEDENEEEKYCLFFKFFKFQICLLLYMMMVTPLFQ